MARGQQPHEPTPETRHIVSLHTSIGTTQAVICDIIGISLKTLRKHYRAELDQSIAKANATIGGSLFNKAKNGDTTAMIFWMKTRAGWSEKNSLDVTSGGKPLQNIDPSKLDTQTLTAILAARMASDDETTTIH